MSRLDPTPADMAWARKDISGSADSPHAAEFILIRVRSWLDDAAEAAAVGVEGDSDASVRRARALIAALWEYRGESR